MSVEKFNTPAWIIGVLFTLVLVFGGAAFASLTSATAAATIKLGEHAERIAKLETLIETQSKLLERLTEAHLERDRRNAQ
jgi:hypothetical protein